MTAVMNSGHHYEIGIHREKTGRVVFVRRRVGRLSVVVASTKIGKGPVRLVIDAEPGWYDFKFSSGKGVKKLARAATRYLSTQVAGGFKGVYLGMYATGNGRPSKTPAYFDWFEYSPKE